MGDDIRRCKLIKFLGIEGKKVDIIPRTDEGIKGISCLTEVWNKKGEYLGYLAYDKRVKWKKFVLIELDKEMQMSRDCLDEAFKLAEDYWKEELTQNTTTKNETKENILEKKRR